MIHHEMYKDLGSLLNKELTDAGYKTNPDYPSPLADQPNADDPTKRDYYYAWNIAYQFGNIIHRMIRPAQRRIYWSKNLLNKYKGGLITPAQMNAINSITADSAAGVLELGKARVRWFLSIDYNNVPDDLKAKGKRTYRSLTMEGREIEFSDGFTDLHTKSYEQILSGNGFGLKEARPSIQTVYEIRNQEISPLQGDYHPMLKNKK